jgi:hypothetical protein
LTFPNKQIRAAVIAGYVRAYGQNRVVCFSCGNASRALKEVGLDVIDISSRGDLMPREWWTPERIAKVWPGYFDATSGHLPLFLMQRIGDHFRAHLGQLHEACYEVPTGSGETILCLRFAYPDRRFVAVYNLDEATQFEPSAPLNPVVRALFEVRLAHPGQPGRTVCPPGSGA